MPDLRVVSEHSQQSIKEQELARALKSSLRNLTGNLIRIARGAGKPEMLVEQLNAVGHAHNAFSEFHGHNARPELLREFLDFSPIEETANDDAYEALLCVNAICRAAMQVVASTLVDQHRQQQNALAELRVRVEMEERRSARRAKERRRAERTSKPQPRKKQP
jgi:hypothetical protein